MLHLSRRRLITGIAGGAVTLASAWTTIGRAQGLEKDTLIIAQAGLSPTYSVPSDGGGVGSNESFELALNTQATLLRHPYVKDVTPGCLVQDFNNFEGLLASSYEVSSDGLVYTFSLKRGIISQGGNEMTADDVIWSFQRKFSSPASSIPALLKPAIDNIDGQLIKIDDYTVQFTIKSAGFGFTFLAMLANLAGRVYDSTLLKEHATADDPYAVEWSKMNPGWGFGAFEVDSVVPDQEMILKASPNYVLGEPELKRIIIRAVSDPGARASLLLTGNVDIANGIRPADRAQLRDAPDVIVPTVGQPIEFLDLTLVNNKPPFDDERVRHAMLWAIPYDEIRKEIYKGDAQEMIGSINPHTKNYNVDALPRFSYSPERSKSILADAGHDQNISFELSVSNAVPDASDAAVLIRSYARTAGFDITIRTMTAADFGQARREANRQALIYRSGNQVQSSVYALTWGTQPNTTSNFARWEKQEFLAEIDQGLAIADSLSPEANRHWERAMSIALESAPDIYICSIQPSHGFTKKIVGYTYRADRAVDYSMLKIDV